MRLKTLILTAFFVFLCFPLYVSHAAETEPNGSDSTIIPELIDVRLIWDQAPHNAFTDLIRFNEKWYCTFRESDKHVYGIDGKIRVITSSDGSQWTSAALLEEEGIDLRDPKLSIAPDNRLMLTIGGSLYKGKELVTRQPRVAFSTDGTTWTKPQKVLNEGDWLWRVTWHKGRAYGVSYDIFEEDWRLKLFTSKDGMTYELVTKFEIPGRPNETTLRFLPNDEAIALVRREGDDKVAWIGSSQPPYTDWTWNPTNHRVGGPNFIVLPNGQLLAAGRDYLPGGSKTALAKMSRNGYEPVLTLPSNGDTSYPGLVWYENTLWMSYYSSHEGSTKIYLAKIKLQPQEK